MDVELILKRLESYGLVRLNKITGDYYSVYCPFHSDGNERRPSCGVRLTDQFCNGQHYPEGWWHCFTCGAAKTMKEAVEEILSVHQVSQEVKDEFASMIDDSIDIDEQSLISPGVIKAINAKLALNNVKSRLNKNVDFIPDSELEQYRVTLPYLYERKLTDEIIEKYDVGIDMHYVPEGGKKEIPCVTFPVRDRKGNILFIVRRAIPIKRFYMPSHIEKPVYGIYELPENSTSVVIVESCFNALTSVRYGRPAVALLGTGTPYQIEQLKRLGVREFILGFDPDEAGRRATKKLKRALKDVAFVWSFSGIPEGKDINDLSEEEFNSLELE